MSWPLAFVKRVDPLPWLPYVLQAFAIVIGLLLGALLLWAMGTDPWEAYQEMARSAFGSVYGLSETLVKATPILLASLGVGVAFRAGFWNIGAEGQLYMGAMGSTQIALTYPELPAPLLQASMLVAGGAAGALWGLIPAMLRERWRVNEIITTLMCNYTVPTYLLMMTPYGLTILTLIIASGRRAQWRRGSPTALGMDYIRGE